MYCGGGAHKLVCMEIVHGNLYHAMEYYRLVHRGNISKNWYYPETKLVILCTVTIQRPIES